MSDPAPEDRALWFFREIVEPTVKEALQDWDDLRRSCLAAIALASMADHYFHARPKPLDGCTTEDKFRAHMGSLSWDYGLVLEVANGVKHAVRRDPIAPGMAQIQQRSLGLGIGRVGEMRLNGAIQVVVEFAPGQFHTLERLIAQSAAMWRTRLGVA